MKLPPALPMWLGLPEPALGSLRPASHVISLSVCFDLLSFCLGVREIIMNHKQVPGAQDKRALLALGQEAR